MDLFDLVAKITIDTGEYESGLNSASDKASSFGSKLKTGLATAAKVGAAAITAVGSAAGSAAGLFIKSASSVAEYGDNIDKMSQKMGMSATTYQEWDAVMQHCGTSIESMQASMKTLASAAETGSEAFTKLGISQQEIASMSQEELFSATITALQNVSDETERTYLAGKLLGRGATELGALLNTSAEDTQAMKDRLHELGGVMSDEAVAAAAKYQDSLQDMQTAINGLKNNIISEFLPSMSQVMDGLGMIFAGEEGGSEVLRQGIDGFISTMSEAIPQVIEIGGQLISSLGGAIVENLPAIMEGGAQLIGELAAGIISAIPVVLQQIPAIIQAIASGLVAAGPSIASAGLSLLEFLANGILSAIDLVISAIVSVCDAIVSGIAGKLGEMVQKGQEIVTNIKNGIAGKIGELIQSGSQIISSVISGIEQKFSDLIQAGRNIIAQVKSGITAKISEAVQWGRDLIDNFVAGITGAIGKVVSAASSVAGAVASILGFSEPEEGPLSNFHTYAPDMMQLFADGIMQNIGLVKNAASSVASALDEAFTGNRNIFIRLDASGYESTKRKILSGLNLGTASVDFASSGLGVSSAGIVNGVSSIVSNGSGSSNPITINLMLPDGTKMASYLLGPLANYAKANGTPILNPT